MPLLPGCPVRGGCLLSDLCVGGIMGKSKGGAKHLIAAPVAVAFVQARLTAIGAPAVGPAEAS